MVHNIANYQQRGKNSNKKYQNCFFMSMEWKPCRMHLVFEHCYRLHVREKLCRSLGKRNGLPVACIKMLMCVTEHVPPRCAISRS